MSQTQLAAPVVRGDRVICRTQPRGIEIVDQVDEIDGDTYLRTVRSFGTAEGRRIRVRAPAAEFEPASDRRLSRRAAARLIAVLGAGFWVVLIWAALVVLP